MVPTAVSPAVVALRKLTDERAEMARTSQKLVKDKPADPAAADESATNHSVEYRRRSVVPSSTTMYVNNARDARNP